MQGFLPVEGRRERERERKREGERERGKEREGDGEIWKGRKTSESGVREGENEREREYLASLARVRALRRLCTPPSFTNDLVQLLPVCVCVCVRMHVFK